LLANGLLRALPVAEYRRLLPRLEPVALKFGEQLHKPGAPIGNIYFPIDCVIAIVTPGEGKQFLGIGLVGFEGLVGISLALGVGVSSVLTLVQTAGAAMSIDEASFREVFPHCPALQYELYRYTNVMLAIARQAAMCNRFHEGGLRLARWLLMTSDRVMSKDFYVTQDFLSDMLGVRRETVTESARDLLQRGLIGYSRGKIRIVNRKGLEAAACSCYKKTASLHDTKPR
jgi:CRP-like cAMP-binding protein